MEFQVGQKIRANNIALDIEILNFMSAAQSIKPNKENEYRVTINGCPTVFSEAILKMFLESVVEDKQEEPKKAVKTNDVTRTARGTHGKS